MTVTPSMVLAPLVVDYQRAPEFTPHKYGLYSVVPPIHDDGPWVGGMVFDEECPPFPQASAPAPCAPGGQSIDWASLHQLLEDADRDLVAAVLNERAISGKGL